MNPFSRNSCPYFYTRIGLLFDVNYFFKTALQERTFFDFLKAINFSFMCCPPCYVLSVLLVGGRNQRFSRVWMFSAFKPQILQFSATEPLSQHHLLYHDWTETMCPSWRGKHKMVCHHRCSGFGIWILTQWIWARWANPQTQFLHLTAS